MPTTDTRKPATTAVGALIDEALAAPDRPPHLRSLSSLAKHVGTSMKHLANVRHGVYGMSPDSTAALADAIRRDFKTVRAALDADKAARKAGSHCPFPPKEMTP